MSPQLWVFEQGIALVEENSSDDYRRRTPASETGIAQYRVAGRYATGCWIRPPDHHASDAKLPHRKGTHVAGLNRRVHRRAAQIESSDFPARRPQGFDFRVGRDIQQSPGAFDAAAKNVIPTNNQSAHGVVARGTGFESQFETSVHVPEVGLRRSCLHWKFRNTGLPSVHNQVRSVKGMSAAPGSDEGLEHARSPYDIAQTIARLEGVFRSHGLTLFAWIDHSSEASRAGLAIRPTHLLIFGDPRVGTPLMIASPSIAIDLPSKALVWEDAEGSAWVTYNKPEYIQRRHSLPAHLAGNLSGITALIQRALDASS